MTNEVPKPGDLWSCLGWVWLKRHPIGDPCVAFTLDEDTAYLDYNLTMKPGDLGLVVSVSDSEGVQIVGLSSQTEQTIPTSEFAKYCFSFVSRPDIPVDNIGLEL